MQEMQEMQIRSLGQENLLEEEMGTHSSVLPVKFQGLWSLACNSPWDQNESDMIEQLNTHNN